MPEHSYLTKYGQDLTMQLWRIYVRELEKTGEPGISNIIPFIQRADDAAGWYLMTYEHRALEVLLEHSKESNSGLSDHSCFGFPFQDVKAILEKCMIPGSLSDLSGNNLKGE